MPGKANRFLEAQQIKSEPFALENCVFLNRHEIHHFDTVGSKEYHAALFELAHEVAHIFHDHSYHYLAYKEKNSSKTDHKRFIREQEKQADLTAVELLGTAQFRLEQLQNAVAADPHDDTHPSIQEMRNYLYAWQDRKNKLA